MAAGTGRATLSVSVPWLVATVVMIAFIWCNSLVPGSSSGSLSLAVVDAVRGALGALGLPNDWVTNFLVRKTAHFTEYAVLGVLASNALRPDDNHSRAAWVALVILLVAVPSLDETIQLFVDGRSGQASDVLLDCCGAATGALLRHLLARRGRTRA